MSTEFQVGDIVSFGGMVGHLERAPFKSQEGKKLILVFNKTNNEIIRFEFFSDGRFHANQSESLLKLVSRPKKMVKKTIERWENVYSDGSFIGITYPEKEIADECVIGDRIACVKLTGSYEVYE